ncbi:Uncharacterised protein [Klebsiella pneumoniae]|nr:Uncharacterised protein [Klebsiella pneumoniae]
MKMSGIKTFLNCYVQKRFATEFICALSKWYLVLPILFLL